MTYFNVLMLVGAIVGAITLAFGIYFTIILYKSEKLGLWDDTVKHRKTLFAVSIISLVCGYIAGFYVTKNVLLYILSPGIIILGIYFLMVSIFYRPHAIKVQK